MLLIRRDLALAGGVLLIVLTSVLTYATLIHLSPLEATLSDEHQKLLELQSIIDEKFFDEEGLKDVALWDGAAQGLVRALGDPYSAYMTAEQYAEMLVQTTGTYSGVGISFGIRNRFFTVIAPMRGTPAAEAGIRAGDHILAVDGEEIQEKPIDEVVSLIRGPEGSEVSLTLQRPPSPTSFVVTLTRANIEVPATESEMLEDDIGYLQIITFNQHTTRDVAQAINQLVEQGAEALVLDLRGNSGGYVHEGVNVASFFIPEGPVVHLSGRTRQETYESHTPALGLPLVLLVDEGTGSTSEIVAGALQDWEVATLVGQPTYGKGLVQELIQLDDASGLRLTTAVYLTPQRRKIHEVGITPDELVERDLHLAFLSRDFDEELPVGSVHWVVMAVQQRLIQLGYEVQHDGVLEGTTAEAIAALQEAAGLQADGRLDADTLWAIDDALLRQDVTDRQLERAIAIVKEMMASN